MTGVEIGGLMGATAAAFTAVGVGISRFLDRRSNRTIKQQSSTIAGYQGLYERQETQIKRMETLIEEQQKSILRLHDMHGECREQSAELYGFVRLLHQIASNNREALLRLASQLDKPISVERIPELPPLKASGQAESEFLTRSTQESVVLTREANKTGGTDASPGSG